MQESNQPQNNPEVTKPDKAEYLLRQDDIFSACAQCGEPVASIKGDSHNYCTNCGFRDSCC